MKKIIKGIESYFSKEFLDETRNVASFLFSYTIIFFISVFLCRYASPFVIAFIIAICFRKVKKKILKINKKINFKILSEEVLSLLLTIILFITVGGILSLIVYKIIIELSNYYVYITDKEILNNVVNNIIYEVNKYVDLSLFNDINELISKLVSIGSNILAVFIKNLLNIIKFIPTGIIYILITTITTFFFIRDIDEIIKKIKWMFSTKSIKIINSLRSEKNNFIGGYIKAYLVIGIVIFLYSAILYKVVDIGHFIMFAFITSVLDALPLIGAGMMYGAFSVVSILNGNFKGAIILILGYLGAVVIRQYLEQRLVSSFLGIPPIIVIIALFFVITPIGFLGMFYFLGAFLGYRIIYKK